MLSPSQMGFLTEIIDTGYTFGTFERTADALQDNEALCSVVSCMDLNVMNDYNSVIDYIFCETWNYPWKKKCTDFYLGKDVILNKCADFSPPEKLWYDIAMSHLIVPICAKIDQAIGPYKWRRVVNNMRSFLVEKETIINSKPDFSRYKTTQK